MEKGSFRALLKYQRPATKDSDIPGRQKLQEEVVRKSDEAVERIKTLFKVSFYAYIYLSPYISDILQSVDAKISITFDAWTSKSYDPYLAITAHYIDAPADQPFEWSLSSKVICFAEMHGRHTGENMAKMIKDSLDEYDIETKVC